MNYPELTQKIKIIDNLFHKNAEKDFKHTELTTSQGKVLVYLLLHQHQSINQKDIEKEFHLSNPTVSGLLNRLEQKGFIQKITDPRDKRYKTIKLTEKSLASMEEILDKLNQAEHMLLEGFTQEEQDQLNTFLDRIVQNVMKNQ